MARKSYEERLKELDEQMEQIKARKQQVASRIKEKERKERTKRLIEVGAIFESYFGKGLTKEEAEKIAYGVKDVVQKNKDKLLKIDVEKSKEQNKVVYEVGEERLIIPEEKPSYQQ